MGAPQLLILSLGLSVATAAAAWLGGRMVERLSGDPRLRDRLWALALALPALPPLAVILLLLLTPAPVREVVMPAAGPVVSAAVEIAAAPEAVSQAFAPDPGLTMILILIAAGLLALWRLGRLALGVRRLSNLLGELTEADAATAGLVEETARRMSTPAPRLGVSPRASEPLLTGIIRPRLILPPDLGAAADPVVVRAMIAHELAHLKRGDHQAIWFEELLVAVLAFNPLMPVLHARRAAAREEVCDTIALADAAPTTRRAYAESLIEALRRRAGPQALPALSFTGAGRRTAMRRLKAVITPSAPAGSAARLLAAGGALAVALAAGAGSLAIAGEREAVVRIPTPTPAALGGDAEARPQASRPAPVTTASEATDSDERQAAAEAFSRLTPEQQARFRDPTAAQYRAICTSGDPADGGFCAGVMFSFLGEAPANGICAPEAAVNGGDRAALGAYVEGGKEQVARLAPRRDESAVAFAGRALQAAYPCNSTAEAREVGVVEDVLLQPERTALLDFPVTLDLAAVPQIQAGDILHLTMDGGGAHNSAFSVQLTPGSRRKPWI